MEDIDAKELLDFKDFLHKIVEKLEMLLGDATCETPMPQAIPSKGLISTPFLSDNDRAKLAHFSSVNLINPILSPMFGMHSDLI